MPPPPLSMPGRCPVPAEPVAPHPPPTGERLGRCSGCVWLPQRAIGGAGHPHLLQQLLDGQVRPESLHEAVEDVLGALELLLLLRHSGLRLEGDVLHVLEKGAQPGQEQ